MRYLMLICTPETDAVVSPQEHMAMPEFIAYSEEVKSRGVARGGNRLRPSTDATTVRVRDGDVVLSDGPFAETKDQIGGYDLIECANLDEAIDLASHHPAAKVGSIEVRPVWEY
jgi:hypothetical protein